jgi:hypothetical protein
MLDLYGQIKSFSNMVSRLNGPEERRGKDVLDPFIAKPETRFLGLHNSVERKMRITAFP